MTQIYTHYKKLNVSRSATDIEIIDSFNDLLKKYNPDNCSDYEKDRFIRITNNIKKSYDILINPITRMEHDLWIDQNEDILHRFENKKIFSSILTLIRNKIKNIEFVFSDVKLKIIFFSFLIFGFIEFIKIIINVLNHQPFIEMVSLPAGFKMGKYEITQEQWKAIMGSNPSYYENEKQRQQAYKLFAQVGNTSYVDYIDAVFEFCDDNCPVESVTFDEVQDFIRRLNQKTGQHYRLPSDEEWYYACQAGVNSKYCGSNLLDEVAWSSHNTRTSTRPLGGTRPVGNKRPNAWGLYDMSGNVSEFTSTMNYLGGDTEYDITLEYMRSAQYASVKLKYPIQASNRYPGIGFRLVQDP